MTDKFCDAVIWKRDTLRYTGRGKSGFEMHYNKCRCSKRAKNNGLCAQHAKIAGEGQNVLRWPRLFLTHERG